MICASTNHSIPVHIKQVAIFTIQIVKGKLVFKCNTLETEQSSGVLP
jgi:hypothetical protein